MYPLRLSIWCLIFLLGSSAVAVSQNARRDSLRILRDTTSTWELDKALFERSGLMQFKRMDTTLNLTRLYEPSIQKYGINTSMGNLGTATQDLIFAPDFQYGFRLGMPVFDLYQFNDQNVVFYKTLRPFTRIEYNLGSSKEHYFDILHTQQIIPGLQAGLQFRHINSEGLYRRQDAIHNNLRFFTRFQNKKNTYKFTLHFAHNDMRVQQNGGLINDSTFIRGGLINGTAFTPNSNRKTYPTWLDSMAYRWHNNALTFRQAISVQRKKSDSLNISDDTPLFMLMHAFALNIGENRNRDGQPNFAYYGAPIIDSSLSKHTTQFTTITNEVKAQFFMRKKFTSKSPLSVGIRHEYIRMFQAVDSIQGDTLEVHASFSDYVANNLIAFGGILLDVTEKLSFDIQGDFAIAGYNLGDVGLSFATGFAAKPSAKVHHQIRLLGQFRLMEPTYFQNNFRSNHITWNNSFSKVQQIFAGFDYQAPEWNLYLKGGVYLLNNWVYFDTTSAPAQSASVATVFRAELHHKFRFWKFFWDNRVTGQFSTTDVIRVPTAIVHSNLYFESMVFKKALLLRIGVDAYYMPPFEANAFSPVTAQFHLQNQITTAGYPFIDVYISGRIKSAKVFFRLRNVNQRLPNIPYFLTPHHPMQDRSFQVGVLWNLLN